MRLCAILLAVSITPTTAFAGGLFAGEWAENCSGSTDFTFHDGDRVKIVDLDCHIVAWKRKGNRYTSDLRCVLDGVRRDDRIKVVVMGTRLRITMGGLSQTVQQCP